MKLKLRTLFLSIILPALILTASLFLSPGIPISPDAACAAEVTLAWDANTETNLAGYRLFYENENDIEIFKGTNANEGDSPITIHLEDLSKADSPMYTLTGLENGQFYYFALTAFNTNGAESDFSDVVGALAEKNDVQNLSKGLAGDSAEDGNSGLSGVCFISSAMSDNASGSPVESFGMVLILIIAALKCYLERRLFKSN